MEANLPVRFGEHPGHEAILRYMPKVFLAVCGNRYADSVSIPRAALGNLTCLYDALLQLEREFAQFAPQWKSPIRADEDFPLAAEMLALYLRMFDPRTPEKNALHVVTLLQHYKELLERAPDEAVTWIKDVHHW